MMTQLMQREFFLFGANKGKTMNIGTHEFFSGRCLVQTSAESMGHIANYLKSYSAFPKGSPEYDEAIKKEEENGIRSEVDKSDGQGTPEEVPSTDESSGEGASTEEADDSPSDADTPQGEEGVRTEGDGHEDSGIPNQPVQPDTGLLDVELKRAVMALDPDNNAHWTADGLPHLTIIEEAYGSTGITRQDVEIAAPGWNREKAKLAT